MGEDQGGLERGCVRGQRPVERTRRGAPSRAGSVKSSVRATVSAGPCRARSPASVASRSATSVGGVGVATAWVACASSAR
ncbi:MAG: hypothetical protein LBJ40_25815 [Delftia acidovorans]|nr:hypothetical protein [Delftia acidovorans]